MARLSNLPSDSAGAAAIELAMLAPILAAMVVGMIDISTVCSDKLRLEQVSQRMIEKVQQSGFKASMETAIETEAQAGAGAGAVANLTYWLECNGVRMTGASAYTTGCPDGQQNARYVQVDIVKTVTPLILAHFTGSNANGTITINGTAGIRIQ